MPNTNAEFVIVGLAKFVRRILDVLILEKDNPFALVLGPSKTNAAYLAFGFPPVTYMYSYPNAFSNSTKFRPVLASSIVFLMIIPESQAASMLK